MLYKIKYTNRFGSAVRRREDGEVAKLHRSEQSYCTDISDVQGTTTCNTTTKHCKEREITIGINNK